MEQTIELMRRRHAFFTEMIEENQIQTGLEFYNKLHELFTMFGVDLYPGESGCMISIQFDGYDFEDYSVEDGVDGGLATVSPIVGWKDTTYLCNDEVDIFADDRRKNSDFVTTGFEDIDALIGGWKKSSLTLLAGRPQMGKTALCCSMALEEAYYDIPVAYFTLEMSAEQIGRRMLSNKSFLTTDELNKGDLNKRQKFLFDRAVEQLKKFPIHIDDTAGISVEELSRKVIEMVEKNEVKIIYIDCINLMSCEAKCASRNDEMEVILTKLNDLAKELSIPVVAVDMMIKIPFDGSPMRPTLSELSEKERSVPQTVCFLYRPDLYDMDKKYLEKQNAELVIAKSPSGATGSVLLGFFPALSRFD